MNYWKRKPLESCGELRRRMLALTRGARGLSNCGQSCAARDLEELLEGLVDTVTYLAERPSQRLIDISPASGRCDVLTEKPCALCGTADPTGVMYLRLVRDVEGKNAGIPRIGGPFCDRCDRMEAKR